MPRMPLSGVRISWLTMARKRDLARLAASAWSRASRERALGLDAVGDVAADALHFGARLRRAPRLRARRSSARRRRWRSSGRARACRRRARRRRPVRARGSSTAVPISASRGLAGERAEGVVGVGDAAARVAAHDQVALRFQQAARALFRLAQFPIAVGQFLDARFQRAHVLARARAGAISMKAMTRAGGGEQRADADGVGVRIVVRSSAAAHAGEEAEAQPDDDRQGGHDARGRTAPARAVVARARCVRRIARCRRPVSPIDAGASHPRVSRCGSFGAANRCEFYSRAARARTRDVVKRR